MSTITIVGNLAEDPTLRYTKGGAAVSNLRVLENTGRYDRTKNAWVEDGEPTGCNVTAWGALAENAAESLHAGDAGDRRRDHRHGGIRGRRRQAHPTGHHRREPRGQPALRHRDRHQEPPPGGGVAHRAATGRGAARGRPGPVAEVNRRGTP